MFYITDQVAVGTYQEALQQEFLTASPHDFRSFLACSRHGLPVRPNTLYGSIKIDDGIPWNDEQKARAAAFIEMGLQRGKVFVYSDFCLSRAPSAVYFYLLNQGMSKEEALQVIQAKCPRARIHPESIHGIATEISYVPLRDTTVPVTVGSEPPLVSIVTVTYNRKDFVRQCLDRLIRVTETYPYELIVVDNGSDDGTLDYLRDWGAKIYLIQCGRNLGKGKAANIGFALAQGKWLCYLDSDILVPEGWFDEIRKIYEKIPKVGWLSLPYPQMLFTAEDMENLYRPAFEERISGGMVFMKRELMNELGGFPADRLYGMMDLDFAKFTRLKGYEVGFAKSNLLLSHLGEKDDPAYIAWKKTERYDHTPSPGPENPPAVDVVLVRFNVPDMEEQCIRALTEYTDWPIHITVVDNYQAKEKLGVLWNRLIKASKCDYICLLNTDTIVTPGWLERMMRAFDDPKVGVVGPSTSSCGTVQAIARGLEPEKAIEYSRELTEKYAGQVEDAELSGFCYLLKKSVWKVLGGFSSEFGFYGQESAFNIAARHAGYRAVWVKDAFVFHHWGGSIKAAEQRGEMDQAFERTLGGKILAELRARQAI